MFIHFVFKINKLAHSLKDIGCQKGDRVGIWSPNCYEWLLTQYATAKIGAILVLNNSFFGLNSIYKLFFWSDFKVNVNPGYRAKELEYCLNLVGCHTLICSQTFMTSNYCEILNSISPNILLNTNGTEVMSEKSVLKTSVFFNLVFHSDSEELGFQTDL